MIRLEDVSLTLDHSKILQQIDLTLRDGEWVALTGRNGSGKSMLMKLMAGLVEPTSGRVTVDGAHSSDGPPRHGIGEPSPSGKALAYGLSVGIAFQNPDSQFVTTSAAREIRFGTENLGLEEAVIESRFHEASALFCLEAFLDRNPHTLSGGEKQRLLLASIWAMRPRHILLDEPCSFLDESSRRSMLETVRRTFREEGRTVVWSTLDPSELAIADRVICIDEGRIVYDGSSTAATDALPKGVIAEGMPALSAVNPGDGSVILETHRAVFSPGGGFELTLPNVSWREGERIGITGPSGSGKTTLLLGCAGLLPPLEGRLTLFGRSIRSRKDFPAGRVAFLFQSPEEGFFAPTVGEEVALANRRFGTGRTDEEAARDALGRVGLDPGIFMDRSPFHLSQGEKRLVALASQLSLPAELFLMDEPTLFLDGSARERLAAALDRISKGGATIAIASHDTSFVSSRTEMHIELAGGCIKT